jgi:hypothetical protein
MYLFILMETYKLQFIKMPLVIFSVLNYVCSFDKEA